MAPRFLKVFGERNTGTRALIRMTETLPGVRRRLAPPPPVAPRDTQTLTAINARLKGRWRQHYMNALRDDQRQRSGCDDPWKHALPRLTPGMIGARVSTLCMVRNPYSWLLSLWRKPYHIVGPLPPSFDGFLARPWMTERRENLDAVLASPMDLWSIKASATRNYKVAAFANGLPCEILRFEDFVLDPLAVVSQALGAMDLPTDGLQAPEVNTKPDGLPLDQVRTRYRDELWRQELTPGAVEAINERLDAEAMAALGYARIDPDEVEEARSRSASGFDEPTAAFT